MSGEEAVAAVDMMCCASCGIAAVDNVKLKKCACGLVKYCSIACQKNHRSQHKKMCKKRLTELRDRALFTQPDESYMGECPICCLPLSVDPSKSVFMSCCSKSICAGCEYANKKREIEAGLQQRCAFCRELTPNSEKERIKNMMKRIKENNDSVAMRSMGKKHYLREGDYETAFKYFTMAAELGDADAHYNLSVIYRKGEVVQKDVIKEVYHLEEAAIAGHPEARHNLGVIEWDNGKHERARKHLIIAANLGFHNSLEPLKELYADGLASKEDYADALRAYQAAVEATKSVQRDVAEDAIKSGDW